MSRTENVLLIVTDTHNYTTDLCEHEVAKKLNVSLPPDWRLQRYHHAERNILRLNCFMQWVSRETDKFTRRKTDIVLKRPSTRFSLSCRKEHDNIRLYLKLLSSAKRSSQLEIAVAPEGIGTEAGGRRQLMCNSTHSFQIPTVPLLLTTTLSKAFLKIQSTDRITEWFRLGGTSRGPNSCSKQGLSTQMRPGYKQ